MSGTRQSVRAPKQDTMADENTAPRASERAVASDVDDYDADEQRAGPATLAATVCVDDPRWGAVNATTLCDIALTALASGEQAPETPASLEFLFSDDDTLARLNGDFRGKAGPTNVLSFPSGEGVGPDGVRFLGSIALAFDTCEREACAQNIHFAHHATHLIVHGVLHLLGFDHEAEADAVVMERAEVDILAKLGIADPYEGK